MASEKAAGAAVQNVAGSRPLSPGCRQSLIVVEIDGFGYPGEVLGRNSSRPAVVLAREGGRYRKWVDASSVRAGV